MLHDDAMRAGVRLVALLGLGGMLVGPVGARAAEGEQALRSTPIGVDILPMVGTSTFARGTDRRAVSFNLIGGYAGAVDALEVAGVFNLERHRVSGLQLAGTFNANAGTLTGSQLAGAVNLTGGWARGHQLSGAANVVGSGLEGAQLTGGANLAGAVRGLQASGAANLAAGDLRGAQLSGGVNLVSGPVDGAQISGAANLAGGPVDGAQLTGGLNIGGPVRGVQISGAANLAHGPVRGSQLSGGVNVAAGGVSGLQLAPVNVAAGHARFQVGVVNIARRSDISLGLVNVIAEGRTHVDVWANETGVVHAGLKHGGDHFHNVYAVGFRPLGDLPIWTATVGWGLHTTLVGPVFLDADLVASHVNRMGAWNNGLNLVSTARAVGGVRLLPGVAVTAGLSYNVLTSTCGYGPEGGRLVYEWRGGAVSAWPGFQLGVQLL